MHQPMRSVYDSLVVLLVNETKNETKYRPRMTNPWATTPARQRPQGLQHFRCSKIFEMIVRPVAGAAFCPYFRSLHRNTRITIEPQLHFPASDLEDGDCKLPSRDAGSANHDRFKRLPG